MRYSVVALYDCNSTVQSLRLEVECGCTAIWKYRHVLVTSYYRESQHQDWNAEGHRRLLDLTMTGIDRFEYYS